MDIFNGVVPPEGIARPKGNHVLIWVIALILLAAVVYYFATRSMTTPGYSDGLTDMERAEIAAKMAVPPGAEDISAAEREALLKKMIPPKGATDISEEERAVLLQKMTVSTN